jgi:hypothetical protein
MSSQAFVNHEDGTIRANATGAYVRVEPEPEPGVTVVRIDPSTGWVVFEVTTEEDGTVLVRLVRTAS